MTQLFAMISYGLTPATLASRMFASFAYIPGKPLFFTDGFFLIFLFLFLFFHTLAAHDARNRMAVILFFSMWFYYKSAGLFFLILPLMAGFTWFTAIQLSSHTRPFPRKSWLLAGVTGNLIMLALFKYTPAARQLLEMFTTLSAGLGAIAFPVGISFYTFSNLSYLFDLKKNVIPAERSFFAYLSSVSLFPLVQMGPIGRPGGILPVIKQKASISGDDIGEGFYLILTGAIKKMVIGDFINLHLVMNIFSAPERYTGIENLAAILGYTMVVYCDFSGYTDMARGIARWMGFRIGLNFNFPYRAWNIGEFWRRWHISLSSWLRDYLFMPVALKLSSNLKKEFLVSGMYIRTDLVIFAISAMITFILCGIWHGNGINFLIWGALHGAALSVQKIWSVKSLKFKQKRSPGSRKFHRFTGVLFTFAFVSASWVFFRFQTPEESLRVFSQVLLNFGIEAFPAFMAAYYPVLAMLIAGYLLHFAPEKIVTNMKARVQNLSLIPKIILSGAVLMMIVYFQNLGSAMPIYIQF